MKNIVKVLILIFVIALQAQAQLLSGIKLCIDPGHGGHDAANDRYIPQTGFWESDGNWDKALHLKEILTGLGAQVILTRQGNNDSDDLPLSQRAGIANSNNVDFFQSIHSNGWLGTSNSTLLLYRGYDAQPIFPQAKTMGAIMVQRIYQVNRTTGYSNRGDWSFYPDWGTSGLGVLRPLNMPGVLSEGSFHDYIPESWRLMNTNYRRSETWAMARSFLEYFNVGNEGVGAIAGVVRDPEKNVTYYYLSGSNDQKKPVNQVQVTLMPGNKVYNGDDKNNGFFFFDSLAPGQYTVYYHADDFSYDSSTVTVVAHQTVFADKFLIEAPNYNPPVITNYTPVSSAINVSRLANIVVDFDIRMNSTTTQSAFSISPTISGSFVWENNNKKMTFDPSGLLDAGTEYTVTIDTNAVSYFGTKIAAEVSFSFSTRSKLNLLALYPDSGAVDVSATVQLRAEFDAAIDPYSLSGNVTLKDIDGNSIGVTPDATGYAYGNIIFEPQQPLDLNKSYILTLKSNIKDMENITLGYELVVPFKTTDETYVSGNVFDTFEDIGGWNDPEFSGSTTGTVPDFTTFSVVSTKKVNGTKSGRLIYEFANETGGVCRVYNSTKPNVGSNASSEVGMWIFGDFSRNMLEYWFYHSSTSNVIVPINSLDWTGWRLVRIPLSSVTGPGDKLFHSIVIRQTSGTKKGTLYFDDAQSDIVTDAEELPVPNRYALQQNYPNPFNPSTMIVYSVPERVNVTIKVYDVLGKEVAQLVNEEKDNGIYRVAFNTADYNLASGIYFYRIKAGAFTSVRKLMLVK
ncbi:MAG: Ig-like domain-containing protein [Ignavibacteriaceae bacterium]|nr:Ig-like domain-containing protein [Ignavibacteriaceae bacterium]